jgi:hypothetical protein
MNPRRDPPVSLGDPTKQQEAPDVLLSVVLAADDIGQLWETHQGHPGIVQLEAVDVVLTEDEVPTLVVPPAAPPALVVPPVVWVPP